MRTQWLFGIVTGALVVATAATPRAQSGLITVQALMSGGAEAPTPVNTGAFGIANITLNPSAGEVSWVIDAYNFPSGLTMGHIHAGSPGTAGPVIVDFNPTNIGQSGAFRLTGTSRTVVPRPAQGIRTMEEAIFAIAAGNTYANLHSQANPGGEIRGQLCPTSAEGNHLSRIALCTSQ
jgi:CHRD domain